MFDKYTWFIIGGVSLVVIILFTSVYFVCGIMMR